MELFKSVWSEHTYTEYENAKWEVVFKEWRSLKSLDVNPQNYKFELTPTETGADVFFRHNTGQLLSSDAIPVINESGIWKINMPE